MGPKSPEETVLVGRSVRPLSGDSQHILRPRPGERACATFNTSNTRQPAPPDGGAFAPPKAVHRARRDVSQIRNLAQHAPYRVGTSGPQAWLVSWTQLANCPTHQRNAGAGASGMPLR